VADQLKTFFSPTLVRHLAGDIERVYPSFNTREFVKAATKGLDDLELLDRGRHIARVLGQFLPSSYTQAIDVLLASLGPEHETDELIGVGMAPFYYLPHTLYIVDRGLEHFDISMHAQYELTKRFSAEGSIRPFIARYPEETFRTLRQWIADPNAHVRRLVSEGTRLRLPWAMRVSWLDENPGRVLELLEPLKDDPSTMVRRSVANNLNDLGKVHPRLLAATCEAWLRNANSERRVLVEHALRSAIKRGEPRALKLLGFGKKPGVTIERVRFAPSRVKIGGSVTMSFTIRSTARSTQDLLIDVAVHFVKARGTTSKKVFKLKRISLEPRGYADFKTTISLKVHTTRKPQPGIHEVDVLVNGAAFRAGAFNVLNQA
jgi:3-methyladenine DNA glycosylase AlkC